MNTFENLRGDVRLALRALRRAPGFAVATLLMLSLSIALNVTAFRALDTMLLRGYPLVRDNDRLLYITERSPRAGCCVSFFDFEQWRNESTAFEDMAFMAPHSISLAEGDGDARTFWANAWTPNIFSLLGVAPSLGRDFRPDDAVPGAAPVAIVSHRYWQTRLGGRPDVVGQSVRIDGAPVTIVGVTPEGFGFQGDNDVWLPLVNDAALRERVLNGGSAYGRLAAGATQAQARAQLEAINARLAREYPDTNRDVRPIVDNYRESRGAAATLFYGSLWLGAWFVLVIACTNAANLALARAQERARELSTRVALGAARSRLGRQLFLEHLMLAAVAGAAAWWISTFATRAWAAATGTLGAAYDYSPSAVTWIYAAALTLGSAAAIAAPPIARLWRLDVNESLKGASRGTTMNLGARRLAGALVVVQMALAVVLISGAGVLARSVWNIVTADVGVESPERVVVARVELPRERYGRREARADFAAALQASLGTLPGVEAAALSNGLPTDDHEPREVEIDGRAGERPVTPIFTPSPGYFAAVGAGVVAGRDFADADRLESAPVALVNQRFAETYFPGDSAVGKRIRVYEKYALEPGAWMTIVGVVSNVMQNESTRQQFRPVLYVPFAQQPHEWAWLFVRSPQLWDGLATSVRTAVRGLDPKLEITGYSTLEEALGLDSSRLLGPVRDLPKNAVVAPIYAALALLLAAIGLYAVVARSVTQRQAEMGIRMALGAAPAKILRLVVAEGMAPVVVGLIAGLAASLGVNQILRAQLVGVAPYDAATLAVAPLILIGVALAGCLRCARTATRVDPAVVLRRD